MKPGFEAQVPLVPLLKKYLSGSSNTIQITLGSLWCRPFHVRLLVITATGRAHDVGILPVVRIPAGILPIDYGLCTIVAADDDVPWRNVAVRKHVLARTRQHLLQGRYVLLTTLRQAAYINALAQTLVVRDWAAQRTVAVGAQEWFVCGRAVGQTLVGSSRTFGWPRNGADGSNDGPDLSANHSLAPIVQLLPDSI